MSDEQEEGNELQFCQPRTTFHLPLSCRNRYAYVLNNPTTLTDPTGLDPDTCTIGDQSGLCTTTTGTSFGPDQCIDSDGTTYCNQIDELGPGDPLIGEYYEWEMCGFMGDCNYQPVGGGGSSPPPKPPPLQIQPPRRISGCEPANDLSLGSRLVLDGLSFFAKLTGVTYFGGLSISRTFAEGVGATVTGNYLYAADPQGGEAIIRSGGVQAAVGSSAFSIGGIMGAATYQTVYGFGGPSTGFGAQYGQGLAVGGAYSQNSSGILTSAFIGAGLGGRAVGGPDFSVGTQITEVCPQ